MVLLFGSETWVLTPRLEKYLENFHHWVVRRMAGIVPKRQRDGIWVYAPIGAALEMVGLEDIGAYIARCHNTVAQYISTNIIMDLCLVVERKMGLRLYMQWWEHPTLYILGIRTRHEAEAGGGGGGYRRIGGKGKGRVG